MAKRKFDRVSFGQNAAEGYAAGDGAAHRAAAALADKFDYPTIAAVSDLLATLDRIGGQAYITTLRDKQPDDTFITLGFAFDFETRDARVEIMEPPNEIEGIPVSDSNEPPHPIQAERPEPEDAVQFEGEPPKPAGETRMEPDGSDDEATEQARERVRREAEMAAQEA